MHHFSIFIFCAAVVLAGGASGTAAALAAGVAGAAAAAAPAFGHALRADFFYPANFTQLNHGAYGGTPRPVVAAQYAAVARMEADLDNFMNGASGYRACIDWARAHLSALINAPADDCVLVDNASEGVNDILRNLEPPLSADEYILDLSVEYAPFVGLYGWLGERLGVQTLTVPIAWPVTGAQSFLAPLQAVLAANASSLNIRVAVLPLISAYPAVTLPVRELVEALHARGIPVIIDGAHALGNIAVDLPALGDVDYAFFNMHKWFFASKSSALLFVRRDHQLAHVPAPAVVDSLETQNFSDRFVWTGTRDRTAYCAIQAAAAYRASIGGEAAILAYNQALALFAKRHLEAAWGVQPMAPDEMMSSLAIVRLPTHNVTECGAIRGALISEYGLGVSGWTALPEFECYLRISAQVYLEQSDIVRLGEAVLAIIARLRGQQQARRAA